MPVAFSTASLRAGAERLTRGAERARELGFSFVHAATPPTDAATARVALQTHHVTLTAVSTVVVEALETIGPAVDRAAQAAATLKHRLVVVEAGALAVPRRVPAETAVETSIEDLVRALHAAMHRHSGLSIALKTADGPLRLVGPRESEWIVSALHGKPFGFWFDTAGAVLTERAPDGAKAMAWADQFGRNVMGVAAHGLAGGTGHGRPEDDGLDWGTLRGLVPSRAPWVLDLSPSLGASEIEESRRYLEHVLGEGA